MTWPTLDAGRDGSSAPGSSPDALTTVEGIEDARFARVGAGTVACRRVCLAARHGTTLARERSHCRAAAHARPAAPGAHPVGVVAARRLPGEGRGGGGGAWSGRRRDRGPGYGRRGRAARHSHRRWQTHPARAAELHGPPAESVCDHGAGRPRRRAASPVAEDAAAERARLAGRRRRRGHGRALGGDAGKGGRHLDPARLSSQAVEDCPDRAPGHLVADEEAAQIIDGALGMDRHRAKERERPNQSQTERGHDALPMQSTCLPEAWAAPWRCWPGPWRNAPTGFYNCHNRTQGQASHAGLHSARTTGAIARVRQK